MGLSDVEEIIHVGRLGDTGKRDLIVEDIAAKTIRIKDILSMKEQLEVDIAPAGVVNFIYTNMGNIQNEIRKDLMTFVNHKAQMVRRLEEMLRIFKDNNALVID
jgi:hypothetical protein